MMAERGSFELHAVRHNRLSRPSQNPFCFFAPKWRRTKESNPHPLREARFSRPVARHCAAILRIWCP